MPSSNLNQEKESASKDSAARPNNVRKVVPGLTIAACMITYMDRVIISVTIPSIQKDLGLSLVAMGTITLSMRVIQFLFEAGEAGAYPVATRSLARWWALPSERGFAQRMTHAGARLGGGEVCQEPLKNQPFRCCRLRRNRREWCLENSGRRSA